MTYDRDKLVENMTSLGNDPSLGELYDDNLTYELNADVDGWDHNHNRDSELELLPEEAPSALHPSSINVEKTVPRDSKVIDAVYEGDCYALAWLISQNASVNACSTGPLATSALQIACASPLVHGGGNCARLLLKYTANEKYADACGRMPVHYLTQAWNQSTAECLQEHGGMQCDPVNQHGDCRGWTPMHYAFAAKHNSLSIPMRTFLHSAGFQNMGVYDNCGYSPLAVAVLTGNFYAVNLHKAAHPECVYKLGTINQENLLHIAARGAQRDISQMLITEYNFSPHCETRHFRTPAFLAVQYGNRDRVMDYMGFLTENGVTLNTRDSENNSLLHAITFGSGCNQETFCKDMACASAGFPASTGADNLELFEWLFNIIGDSLYQVNIHGMTPLHTAAYAGQSHTMKMLLDKAGVEHDLAYAEMVDLDDCSTLYAAMQGIRAITNPESIKEKHISTCKLDFATVPGDILGHLECIFHLLELQCEVHPKLSSLVNFLHDNSELYRTLQPQRRGNRVGDLVPQYLRMLKEKCDVYTEHIHAQHGGNIEHMMADSDYNEDGPYPYSYPTRVIVPHINKYETSSDEGDYSDSDSLMEIETDSELGCEPPPGIGINLETGGGHYDDEFEDSTGDTMR